MTELVAKRADESVCSMTEFVLPSHANAFGTVFGGTIMSWVDLCAAIAAQRHARRSVVTAFVDDLHFEGSVKVGQVVRLEGRVTATFRTSMEIEVIVQGEDASTGETWPCVSAMLTFVAIDETTRKPMPVPPLLLEDDDDRRRHAEAEERRARRLGRATPSRRAKSS